MCDGHWSWGRVGARRGVRGGLLRTQCVMVVGRVPVPVTKIGNSRGKQILREI